MIIVEHLRKKYDDNEVLSDINFTLEQGKVLGIIGPSGSGKSTLIRCLNYLEQPTSGIIELAGRKIDTEHIIRKDITYLRQNTTMVFQQFNLFKQKTALENITLGPITVHKIDKQTAVLQAKDLLEKVGLADRADYYPNELSGGQQQRVALARALALNPKLLLLDEPTSALDPEMIGEVLSVIKRFNDGTRTMIIVSHEMGFLADIADKILFLESGLVQAEGSPEEVFGGHRSERLNRFLSRVRWSDHAPTNRKKEVLDD